jgi:hypothetical protein
MGFRLGLLAGLAVGYLQGTKAGRERYEQIRQQMQKLRRTEPVQRLSSELESAAGKASETLGEAATKASETIGEAANKSVDKVRNVVHRQHDEADSGAGTVTTLGANPPEAALVTEPISDEPNPLLSEPVSDPVLEEPSVADPDAAGGPITPPSGGGSQPYEGEQRPS